MRRQQNWLQIKTEQSKTIIRKSIVIKLDKTKPETLSGRMCDHRYHDLKFCLRRCLIQCS